ncbi:MAG: glycoside hydrolase family 71/99-like protein [Bacteroidota bacterium]
MKTVAITIYLLIWVAFFCSCSRDNSIDPSRIDNKVICGYQGWFNAQADGSPVNRWVHWSSGAIPDSSNITFELYPDITNYNSADLHETGLGNLPDGSPSRLFTSYSPTVINQHFSWMQQNGIHGVALQRFIEEVRDPVFKQNRDSIAGWVRNAAEDHERVFYMMYDLSGMSDSGTSFLFEDWDNTFETDLKIIESPAYAHQDGKPVIALWGLGFAGRPLSLTATLEIINWFKAKGYFVIGGVPTFWRDGDSDAAPGFEPAYLAMDMISPWTIGRFEEIAGADIYKERLRNDKLYCDANGILYQPVMFPGFAWSNWNGGPQNQIPRVQGDFLWRQAFNIRSQGINSAYLAMFDEYDEATAVMPIADSYLQIPEDQYFLTSSADGKFVSSDFYLMLAGKISGLFLFNRTPEIDHMISPYRSPVYFRTSFEPGYDALPDWLGVEEETTASAGVSGPEGAALPEISSSTAQAGSGEESILLRGIDESESTSLIYYKIFDVDIPVFRNTYLSYDLFAANEGGRNVATDLIMSDGTTLRDSPAVDTDGIGMHPGAIRGRVGEWKNIKCNVGNWLEGAIIDRIVIAYDFGPERRPFEAYVDNVIIHVE